MLAEYLGQCGPYAAFFDVVSLNTPVSELSGDGDDAMSELIDTLPSLSPTPEDEYLLQDILTEVGVFVDELPAPLKRVAILHFWDGHTQIEIAHELGISQSAVSQRLAKVIALGRTRFCVSIH